MHLDDMAHELRRLRAALERIASSEAFGPASADDIPPEFRARMDFAQAVLDGEPLIGLASRCYRKVDPMPDFIRKKEDEAGVERWRKISDECDAYAIERDKSRYAGVDP